MMQYNSALQYKVNGNNNKSVMSLGWWLSEFYKAGVVVGEGGGGLGVRL